MDWEAPTPPANAAVFCLIGLSFYESSISAPCCGARFPHAAALVPFLVHATTVAPCDPFEAHSGYSSAPLEVLVLAPLPRGRVMVRTGLARPPLFRLEICKNRINVSRCHTGADDDRGAPARAGNRVVEPASAAAMGKRVQDRGMWWWPRC